MDNSEQRFAELKQKFSPILEYLDGSQASIQNLQIQDNKLLLRAVVPSEESRAHVMKEIQRLDPSFDEIHADIRAEPQHETPNTGATSVQSDLEFSRD